MRSAQAELPRLRDQLLAVKADRQRVRGLLRQLACAWPRLMPSTSYGAVGGESGLDDAFESVITILRRRLGRAEGDWPLNGDITGPGASAEERQERLRGLQLPDVCSASSVAWGVEGGDATAGGAAGASGQLRLPCRHSSSPLGGACPPELMDRGGAVCQGVQVPPCPWPRRGAALLNATYY